MEEIIIEILKIKLIVVVIYGIVYGIVYGIMIGGIIGINLYMIKEKKRKEGIDGKSRECKKKYKNPKRYE